MDKVINAIKKDNEKEIIDIIIDERKGMYCHCLEVHGVYELETVAEGIIQEFQDTHSEKQIIDFLSTLEIYCLDDDNEKEVFNFSFSEFIKDTI